jgi:arsenate reductase
MRYTLLCYDRCATCRKAENFLKEKNIPYEKRAIRTQNPTEKEIRDFARKASLPLSKLFNTSGLSYKSLGLSQKLAKMTDAEKARLLASDGMLVKRPVLIGEDKVLVGFKIEEWKKL